MKYRKFSTRNHPILGDIDIDFTINGNTADTILIVGENACGKTILLKELFELAQTNKIKIKKPIESISAEIELNDQERKFFKTTASIMTIKNDSPSNQSMCCDKTYVYDNKESNDIYLNWRGGSFYESILSNVDIGFTQLDNVKPVASQDLDKAKDSIISTSALASEFIRLLLDIYELDKADEEDWKKKNPGKVVPEEVKSRRMSRFMNAYNSMFEEKKFIGVDKDKQIMFQIGARTMNINQLSSGEKQIVFRGGFLLKDKNSLKGANVLIDEPEISLHPKWQKDILKFYRNLFTGNGCQTSQIFFATHSENVLKSAIEEIRDKEKKGQPEDILIIALENKEGVISAKKIDTPFILPSLTFAEINYHVFDVISNDLHIALYGYLQSQKELYTVKKCDNYIKKHPLYDVTKHKKTDAYDTITYETLPTYIRNAIDHPSPSRSFTQDELRCSIKLLIEIIRALNGGEP